MSFYRVLRLLIPLFLVHRPESLTPMQRSAYPTLNASLQRLIPGLSLALVSLLASIPGKAQQASATGQAAPPSIHEEVYIDHGGAKHPWTITSSHSLLWEGTPYLPVGGTFAPRSLQDDSDAAWQEDVRSLNSLKAKGILDLLLTPSKSLPAIPLASFQRLLDYLDTNGFRYGLSFGPGLTKPLSGVVVKPANYRYFEADSLTAHWRASNADKGFVAIVEDNGSGEFRIVKSDTYTIKDNFLSVPLEPVKNSGRLIGLLYPHKTLPTGTEGALPDLWSGFDDYRDQLLAYLGQVKFGKGLRFLLDPLARHLGLAGEFETIIPESEAFRLEWESYLSRIYPGVEDAKARWAMMETDLKSFDELSRLVPLWQGNRGIGYLYDPQGDKMLRVDSTKPGFWQDFYTFRNQSIAGYMKSIASVLKHQVADVPVVYTWTQNHPIFFNGDTDGFDGYGLATHGTPSVARQLGPVLGAIEQAARPMWYVATEVSPNVPLPAPVSPQPPPGSPAAATRAALFGLLDDLKKVGVKGFFASDSTHDNGVSNIWVTMPDRLDWLHDYGAQLGTQTSAARYEPHVLFYPQNAPGPAHIGPVPGASNVLWLSSVASGESLDLWPSFSGYIINLDESHAETVLISNNGPRQVHILVPDNRSVQAFTPDGAPVAIKLINKTEFLLRLDTTPTIIKAGSQRLILREAAEDAISQLEAMMVLSRSSKSPETQNVKASVYQAQDAFTRKNYDTAYLYARVGLDQLIDVLKPYIWFEGEATVKDAHTFDDIGSHPEASGERFLRLSNPNPPSKYGYGAHWEFDVVADGRYNVWMAGSVPGPSVSPMRWAIDTAPNLDPVDKNAHGALYASDSFGWTLLGAANLKKGRHVLEIEVIDRAVSPPIYNFGVDAFLLTRSGQTPSGTLRPVPVDAQTLQSIPKLKQKQKE